MSASPAFVGLACAGLAAAILGAFTVGKSEGAREVRINTVVRFGFPIYTGAYQGVCAPVAMLAPGGSAAWMLHGEACATDQPELFGDLLPGESATFVVAPASGVAR